MLASLWQNACLVTYGNAWLAGEIDSPAFRDLPGFDFSRELKVTVGWDGPTLGDDLTSLYEAVRQSGAQSVRLMAPNSRADKDRVNMAAFAGSPSSAVVFTCPDKELLVLSEPELDEPVLGRRQIWKEHFAVFQYTAPWPELTPDMSAKARLAASCTALRDFAVRHSTEHWAEFFQSASASLAETDFPQDVERTFPAGADLERKQLFYGAGCAWPFGGMGSWNDQGFESDDVEARYETLNSNHWDALLGALIWSVRP